MTTALGFIVWILGGAWMVNELSKHGAYGMHTFSFHLYQFGLMVRAEKELERLAGLFVEWHRARPQLYPVQDEYLYSLVTSMIEVTRLVILHGKASYYMNKEWVLRKENLLQSLENFLSAQPPRNDPPPTAAPASPGALFFLQKEKRRL